jgi:hypothetical protein
MKTTDIINVDWNKYSLIAIDECRMLKDNRPTLTIDKNYHPIDVKYGSITILNDENEEHIFNIDGLEEFFEIKENKELKLFIQFDDDEPLEAIKVINGNNDKFVLEMLPAENSYVEFKSGGKKFKMFLKKVNYEKI